jgi:hypothetical protein
MANQTPRMPQGFWELVTMLLMQKLGVKEITLTLDDEKVLTQANGVPTLIVKVKQEPQSHSVTLRIYSEEEFIARQQEQKSSEGK